MKDVVYQELETANKKTKVAILMYTGEGDPVRHLNEAVAKYVRHELYNEFIDANMNNPWVRVIIKGINDVDQVEFRPETSHL
jgi:hypothetical protein